MRTIVRRLRRAVMKQQVDDCAQNENDVRNAATSSSSHLIQPSNMGSTSSKRQSSAAVAFLVPKVEQRGRDGKAFAHSSTRINGKGRRTANFRDDFGPPMSSSSSFSSSNDVSYPHPSPSKFPKTNPFFKSILPRDMASRGRSNSVGKNTAHPSLISYPIAEESESTTTDSAFTTSQSNSISSDSQESVSAYNQRVQMKKILAGLKTFGIKGEVYVSIILNRAMLTISVEEARNLQPPPACTNCNAYIRLSLMPDEEKRTQYKSEIVPASTSPVFNLNVSFEVLPEDARKRVLISLWHRDPSTQKGSLLGCMAFSIRSLLQEKQVEGWYYLLSPNYGRQKHLAVEKVNMLTYYGSVDSLQQQLRGRAATGPIFI